jgi:serine/threonine-protein kinase
MCPRCGAGVPEGARFCPSCGAPVADEATVGATGQPTRLSPDRAATRRTPAPDPGPAKAGRYVPDSHRPGSGWLSSSDSISHGRFAPGVLLDGRYRIIGLLGRGGMGEVYRADDLRLGQPVALKFLPEGLRHDPVRLAQFHNEVRTARQVSHPNVCRVYDIGEADGLLYLTMEYVDGEDLAASLRRIGRFPEDRALELARQLCAGLAAAHQRGVVHRDLKPANVMLDGAGHVRIMDFGLAALGAVEDVRAGTPAYMAPEQLLGREVSTCSDIFALGLVLYELFTGRRAFTAATVGDLVGQHQTRSLTPPSAIVTSLDPAIERAVLRCLEPDPERRPGSALAVSAALPGGDPLAAALAAGETPSPEMVAAAGEGAGLNGRIAWPVFVAVLLGTALAFVMALRATPLDLMRPAYTDEVLAQKARDAIGQIGYTAPPADEAYGFGWDFALIDHVEQTDAPAPQWTQVLTARPSPLQFWYRQSPEAMTGLIFHSDLLTPGIVTIDDPPPIISGMIQVELDHHGHLTYFEAIPPQREETPTRPAPVDWGPLFALAGLDADALEPAEPLWNWLASSDTRAAWTGRWPGSGRPLRVEGAALGGRPVAFMLTGPWRTTPARMRASDDARTAIFFWLLMGIAAAILLSAGLLARSNLRTGRGDRRGALRLAFAMIAVLLGLWVCSVHPQASPVLLAIFVVALATSIFYGVLLWTIYMAVEPFVRRHWPKVLVSWANLLGGRIADPVVGRDVLFGVGLGVFFTIVIRSLQLWGADGAPTGVPGDPRLLLGPRAALAVVLEELPYAIRNVLLYFFVLFVFRVMLRRELAAVLAFTAFLTLINALGNDDAWQGALLGLAYFGTAAYVVRRWGLLPFVVGAFVSPLLFDFPATLDTSAWYFGNMLVLIALVIGLAFWGLYTSMAGRLWKAGLGG